LVAICEGGLDHADRAKVNLQAKVTNSREPHGLGAQRQSPFAALPKTAAADPAAIEIWAAPTLRKPALNLHISHA